MTTAKTDIKLETKYFEGDTDNDKTLKPFDPPIQIPVSQYTGGKIDAYVKKINEEIDTKLKATDGPKFKIGGTSQSTALKMNKYVSIVFTANGKILTCTLTWLPANTSASPPTNENMINVFTITLTDKLGFTTDDDKTKTLTVISANASGAALKNKTNSSDTSVTTTADKELVVETKPDDKKSDGDKNKFPLWAKILLGVGIGLAFLILIIVVVALFINNNKLKKNNVSGENSDGDNRN